LKRYLAEFVAAFFLVFVGMMAIMSDTFHSQTQVTASFGLLGIALAHGLALAVAIAAVARISGGHANPAVSIAFFVARRISFSDLLGYVAFQLLGGIAAAFLVKRLVPADVYAFSSGAPALGKGIEPFTGAAIEVLLTFFLAFVIWGVAVDKKGPKNLAPFAIGLTVSFGILAGADFTGAAMNPARWFGPALAAGSLGANWYVWIAGPILGALLGSLVYETFFLDEEVEVEVTMIDDDEFGDDDEFIEDEIERKVDFRDTPSPMTPPSPQPPPSGADSPMVPPPTPPTPPTAPAPPTAPTPPTPPTPPTWGSQGGGTSGQQESNRPDSPDSPGGSSSQG